MTEPRGRSRRRWLVGVVSVAVTVGLLVAVLTAVDFAEVGQAFIGASLPWLGLAFGIAFFFKSVQSAETARWILRGLGVRVAFVDLLVGTLGGLALREVLPGGTGNLTRAAYLIRRCGTPAAAAATAEIGALWIKLAWLFGFCAAGVLVTPEVDDRYAAVGIVGVLLWALASGFARKLIGIAAARAPTGGGAAQLLADLDDSLAHLRPTWPWAMTAFHTLASIVGEWVVFAIVLVSLGHPVPFGAVVAFIPIVAIATKLPITFMGFGAREALVLALFAPYAPGSVLVAAGLLASTLDRVAPVLIGSAITPLFLARIVAGPDEP